MTEEDTSPDKSVWLLFSEFCNLGLHVFSHGEASEFDEEFLVINAFVSGCLNLEGRNKIFLLNLIFFAVFLLCLG